MIEKVLKYLEMNDTPSNRDSIELFYDGVLSIFWNHTGVNLQNSTGIVEYYDGGGERSIFLDRFPVIGVDSIEYNTGTGKDPIREEIEYDYVVRNDEGMITFPYANVPRGYRNIKITYSAGYTDSEMPSDIVLALCKEVKKYKSMSDKNTDGIQSERIDDYSVTFDKNALDPTTIAVLDKYRRIYV